MKTPVPLKGWRVFAGEVGVIVFGVLLALGAQQAVQEWQIRGDVQAFRQTIDHEIGLNLFTYDVRLRQIACTSKHVKELRDWLDHARLGATVPALWPNGPLTLSPYRSAWNTKNGDVFAHLPDNARQKYAEFYDELDNNYAITVAERQAWETLVPYAEPGPISLDDRRKIRSALGSVRGYNSVIEGNFRVSRKIASQLNIRMVEPDVAGEVKAMIAKCPSAIAPKP